MTASFYDLDFIIEVNQKRLDEYNAALQKVLEQFTHILLIYSALGIFLISLIQHILDTDIKAFLFYAAFTIFFGLLLVSVIYFIRLLSPAKIAYLRPPRFYIDIMQQMEEEHEGDREKVNNLLKGSYIDELEDAISINSQIFRRKRGFCYNAFLFAILAVIPYLICIGYHLAGKNNKNQETELIDRKK